MGKANELKPVSCSADQTIAYLRRKGANHNFYKHYTSLDRVQNSIVDGKSLYLSRGDSWNDRADAARFNHDRCPTVNYAMCFSAGEDENVAMWMLYGGILSQGGMIDFTKKDMHQILTTPTIELGNFEGAPFVPLQSLSRDQFDIYLADMLYYTEHSSGYRLTRGEDHASPVSQETFDELTMYTKKYAWSYEKECRLIVSIDKKYVQCDAKHIKIDISKLDLSASFGRLFAAPDRKAPPVQGFQSSKLGSDIKWNVCGDCICRDCACHECPY